MVKDLLIFWMLKGLIGILLFVLLYILAIIFIKWLFNTITADSEKEAVEKLKKKHNKNNKKVNYIISISEL